MQPQNLFDNYLRDLGKVIGNLQSLELMVRLFLHNVEFNRYGVPAPEVDLNKIEVGDIVPENYFSNYDSLGDLIKEYNNLLSSRKELELCVDETIVRLRDALAHGRVLGQQPEPPQQLYKFEKPSRSHQVRVEQIANLTESELKRYIHHSFEQIKKVEKACKKFCPRVLS